MLSLDPLQPDFTVTSAANALLGPVQPRVTGAVFTVVYSQTVASAVTATTLTVRSSDIPRFAAVTPTAPAVIPGCVIASVSAPNPQPGFSVTSGIGEILLNATFPSSFEQTFYVPFAGKFLWIDWVYGSGGGVVTAAIWIAPSSLDNLPTRRGL
jgi:hypothetical protein